MLVSPSRLWAAAYVNVCYVVQPDALVLMRRRYKVLRRLIATLSCSRFRFHTVHNKQDSSAFIMKFKSTVLAFAASASAISTQLVKNFCPDTETIYLTLAVNATEDRNGPFIIPTGEAFVSNITGDGNTAIVSKDPNIYTSIPKIVLGTSSDNQVLYW